MPTCPACEQTMDAGLDVCPKCGVRSASGASAGSRLNRSLFSRGFGCGCSAVVVALAVALCLPRVQSAREAARCAECRNNLKQIGLALRSYHDAHGCFPPARVADVAGRPLHSWRVLILPYVDDECRALHADYSFSEPWDSPANAKLLERCPAAYKCPTRGRANCRQCTAYTAGLGPKSVLRDIESMRLEEITDGASSTILVAEATAADIPWTKPEDVDLTLHPKPGDPVGISSDHSAGFHVVLADGNVRFISNSIEPRTFEALFTADGNDTLGDDF